MGSPHRVGIVGLGVISGQYLTTLAGVAGIRITAVADLDTARAEAAADRIDGCRALSVANLLADPEIDTVLNLTIPAAHAEIALAALAAGKNVYGEKPLAATLPDAQRIMAERGDAWVGGAPDTVLGTGIQTARAAVDEGLIGRPLSATATWVSAGHEAWHPHPDFYYREGGGPLLDMGPYYLTSLVHLLGPVVRVTGVSRRARDERTIASGPRLGERIPVEVDTHVTGILEHASGAVSTVVFSFDAVRSEARPLEIHGEDASLTLPDPNMFDGDVALARRGAEWQTLPVSAGYADAGRGIGLIDIVRGGHGADGSVALHVLDIMSSLLESGRRGAPLDLVTTVARPALVPLTPREVWSREV
ncbi:Gfo/Idh/MocA family protein [Microbacterium aurantiacum]|uniref:Gfo/Idh/MocA family protein n=1 Tax=Microbacterium aurantiacum TaxID=162393 RepID=UPI003F49153A